MSKAYLNYVKTIEKKLRKINYNSLDEYFLHCVRNRVKKRTMNATVKTNFTVAISEYREFFSKKTLKLWDLLERNHKKNRIKISKEKIKLALKKYGYKNLFEMIKHHAEQNTTLTSFALLFDTNCEAMRIIFSNLKLSKKSQQYANRIVTKKKKETKLKKRTLVVEHIDTPAWDNYLKLYGKCN